MQSEYYNRNIALSAFAFASFIALTYEVFFTGPFPTNMWLAIYSIVSAAQIISLWHLSHTSFVEVDVLAAIDEIDAPQTAEPEIMTEPATE